MKLPPPLPNFTGILTPPMKFRWACTDGAAVREGVAGMPDVFGASTCAPVCGDGRSHTLHPAPYTLFN